MLWVMYYADGLWWSRPRLHTLTSQTKFRGVDITELMDMDADAITCWMGDGDRRMGRRPP